MFTRVGGAGFAAAEKGEGACAGETGDQKTDHDDGCDEDDADKREAGGQGLSDDTKDYLDKGDDDVDYSRSRKSIGSDGRFGELAN